MPTLLLAESTVTAAPDVPVPSVRLVEAGEVREEAISPAKVGVAPGSRRWGSVLRRCMVV